MLQQNYSSKLAMALGGRKLWMLVAVLSITSNLMLSCKMLNTSTAEKTIVTPPVVDKAFWVHGDEVSPEYLEQMALFFTDQVLTYSMDNIAGRVDVFLRHVDPASYGPLKVKLTTEADRIVHSNLASVFFPVDVRIRQKPEKKVAITGDLVSMVGEKTTGKRRAIFVVSFKYTNGRLYVANFDEVFNEADPFNDQGVPAGDAAAGSPPG